MLFCRDFQTGKCSHTKDHYGTICNERKWLQHICAHCWTSSRTIARHSEFSVECRGSSPSSSSSFDPPATTSTWLSSDKDGVFSIDVVSPASHDSRLCKIFSPVAGAGSCSYVDSSTMDSRGFPDMPDISISPDSSLSEDISRPFPTFSPMVADFSSCIDSCPFQPFLDLHACVSESRVYNFQGLRLPVPSSLRLAVLFTRLRGLCHLWFFRIWLARWIRLFLFFSKDTWFSSSQGGHWFSGRSWQLLVIRDCEKRGYWSIFSQSLFMSSCGLSFELCTKVRYHRASNYFGP